MCDFGMAADVPPDGNDGVSQSMQPNFLDRLWVPFQSTWIVTKNAVLLPAGLLSKGCQSCLKPQNLVERSQNETSNGNCRNCALDSCKRSSPSSKQRFLSSSSSRVNSACTSR